MPTPSPLPCLLLLLLMSLLCAAAAPTKIPLYRHLPASATTAHHHHPISRLAQASLARATNLRAGHHHGGAAPAVPVRTVLDPLSYGVYTFFLSLGTPPHPLPVLLDTASPITWVPCTDSYRCIDCTEFFGPFPVYHPKKSSTSRLVSSHNPACLWIHCRSSLPTSTCPAYSATPCWPGPDPDTCNAKASNICPPYVVVYGSGTNQGLLLSDTLCAGSTCKTGFAVGCTASSVHQPTAGLAGFAGFGRGAPSLPAQLGFTKFSYCLHLGDNATDTVSGELVLGASSAATADKAMQYVPLLKNAAPYSVYYYLSLTGITVGGKTVRLPPRAFAHVPSGGTKGNGGGGTIIDSGTTFTYMDPTVFSPVMAAVVAAVRYNRSKILEDVLGLCPCFVLPADSMYIPDPELSLRFRGGAEMRLPIQNYIVFAGRVVKSVPKAICLAVVSDIPSASGGAGVPVGGGPAIILGSFQQKNYHVEYDLEKERLGFRPQPCSSKSS